MTDPVNNVDAAEVERFNALAARWWDPEGDMKPLHRMNPVRVAWIAARAELAGRRVVDVGCGGGLLCESLAAHGAEVTGIDLAAQSLAVARLHQAEAGGPAIDYRETSADALAEAMPGEFDVVTCLEVLEHVPDPARLVSACARLARPGGQVFFSTINRNAKAFAVAILAAEYLLGLLPRGTHRYEKLIRPSELDGWARKAGLELLELSGLHAHPVTLEFRTGGNVDVNYLAHFRARA